MLELVRPGDAAKFGDEGADTLGHTAEANGGLNIPNMVKAWNRQYRRCT